MTYQSLSPHCNDSRAIPVIVLSPFITHMTDSDNTQPSHTLELFTSNEASHFPPISLMLWTLSFPITTPPSHSQATNFFSCTHLPWHLYTKIVLIPSITSMLWLLSSFFFLCLELLPILPCPLYPCYPS